MTVFVSLVNVTYAPGQSANFLVESHIVCAAVDITLAAWKCSDLQAVDAPSALHKLLQLLSTRSRFYRRFK